MTKHEFKTALNKELDKAGSIRIITLIGESGANTTLFFKAGIDMKTLQFLNNRFHYGIHLKEGDNNHVYINTPFEKKVHLS